jgi:hypothetical protein
MSFLRGAAPVAKRCNGSVIGYARPVTLSGFYSSPFLDTTQFRHFSFARADPPLGKIRQLSTTRVRLRTRAPNITARSLQADRPALRPHNICRSRSAEAAR